MRGATTILQSQQSMTLFQSTLLMRGATFFKSVSALSTQISIHAPHARSDVILEMPYGQGSLISIHAPHARSDTNYIHTAYK